MSMQFLFGVPEALLPVDDPVVFYFHALGFEAFLHGGGCFEKLARTKLPDFIHDAVRRNALFVIAAAHGPTDLPRATFITEISGNGTVGSGPTRRNLPYHVVNIIEKVISLFHARSRGLVVFRRFRLKADGTSLRRKRG